MRSTRLVKSAVAGTIAATLLLVSACGSSDSTAGSSSSSSSAAPAASSADGSTADTPAASGSEMAPASSSAAPVAGGAELSVLIGSSGQVETDALMSATDAWGKDTGNKVTVAPAQDLGQQLAQGFSSNTPPDLFYVGADQVANYAKADNIAQYADGLSNASDFYPALKDSFTYDGKFYCAPKDMSTLALFINNDLWAKAGLTDADIPKNWDDLAKVAKKLTVNGVAGLALAPERDRIDAFLVQNGAYLTDDAGKITANDPKNVEALTFVKKMMTDGVVKTPAELSAGWAGEAFGKQAAAMTIEGNWLLGAMGKDFPTVKYTVAELPAGPTGTKGTLVFTNCWGISATTKFPEQAKALVEYLTGSDQQMTFAKAFGVIPSVESAKDTYLKEFPKNKPFVDGVGYARGVVNFPGVTAELAEFNAQLQALATGDPQTILDDLQKNLEAAIG
ncbi:extracellular solute-binding protein [Nakamurella antarctica]|uniref:Extracellular solute-binding protein n=1 Tax=Nakamurella antarctica TaxID=1902245 RepID=A0A3G8ZID6_9ACTN|nr:extracellular solute-binding protein [Nakamurella antarctica]AZI56970.1 extracellular solute-binding protein [Nakamurella antarctica]